MSSCAVIPNVSTLKHNKWTGLQAGGTPCSVNILVQRTFKQNLKQPSNVFSKIKEVHKNKIQYFLYIITNKNLEKI